MIFFEGIFNKKPFTEKSRMPQVESYPEYHELIVMDCTGRKDKNGKEIYECDIMLGLDCTAIVRWDVNGYIAQKKNDYYHYNILFNGWEIIGNIYQDNDLMEQTT